jgi:hypothetical protein
MKKGRFGPGEQKNSPVEEVAALLLDAGFWIATVETERSPNLFLRP